jgi:glycerol-3-phosphate acyltransferase PlsY
MRACWTGEAAKLMGTADGIVAVVVPLAAYLLGSIPFSFAVARLFGVQDVRKVGSGNVGATNVMRSAGRTAGIIALVLDTLKGALASWLVLRLFPLATSLAALAAAAAVLGHMYPVWLGFRGGKGVATGAGAFLPLATTATLGALAVFAVILAATRYVSVASVSGALALGVLTWLLGAPRPVASTALALALLIGWKHRANLRRIASGTENRLGRARAGP